MDRLVVNKKFEYKYITLRCNGLGVTSTQERELNALGAQGWEVITVIRNPNDDYAKIYLKREYYENTPVGAINNSTLI